MKLTSGRRKQERQGRALDRLIANDQPPTYFVETGERDVKRDELWKARREREIETLRKRTGRFA